jgi:hypothetical protein
MNPRQQQPAASPRPRRLSHWRNALVLFALVCAVSLYSIEATHNHAKAADELHCPVCHVVGHNALDSYQPNTDVLLSLSGWYASPKPRQDAVYVQRTFDLKPRTRAPPAPALSSV